MKLGTEGGFSSKLRIESLIEQGHEARTHRPSPSSSNKTEAINILTHIKTREEISRNKVSIPEGVLGLTKVQLNKSIWLTPRRFHD